MGEGCLAQVGWEKGALPRSDGWDYGWLVDGTMETMGVQAGWTGQAGRRVPRLDNGCPGWMGE
eukprot:145585-Chlamydomonas_euryale.AAC.1